MKKRMSVGTVLFILLVAIPLSILGAYVGITFADDVANAMGGGQEQSDAEIIGKYTDSKLFITDHCLVVRTDKYDRIYTIKVSGEYYATHDKGDVIKVSLLVGADGEPLGCNLR